MIQKSGFERNAAIIACKEAANENDETRKRFEVMCREVFKKFKACINVQGVNACRADRDAINIVYKSLQQDREQADITDIVRLLHQVVDEVIVVRSDRVAEPSAHYDISKIDFERLRHEFDRSPKKNTTVQNLREAVEQRLQRLLRQNPLRTNFQQHYEQIVSEYNREKERGTIEKTFEALFKLEQELDDEAHRAMREGLDEESLAIFDLLNKPNLKPSEIQRIKAVATQLLMRLKEEKLQVDQWREKEATRDAVRQAIHNFLWSENTGLPVDCFAERTWRSRPRTSSGISIVPTPPCLHRISRHMPRCDPLRAPKHPQFSRSLVFRGRLLAMKPGEFEEIISKNRGCTHPKNDEKGPAIRSFQRSFPCSVYSHILGTMTFTLSIPRLFFLSFVTSSDQLEPLFRSPLYRSPHLFLEHFHPDAVV